MEIVDSYKIVSENIEVLTNIEKEISGLKYHINIPKISKPTSILLLELKKRLILEVTINTSEILDIKVIKKIKEKFIDSCHKILDSFAPGLNTETRDFLTGTLIHDMLGLGDIEFLLNDNLLEEVV